MIISTGQFEISDLRSEVPRAAAITLIVLLTVAMTGCASPHRAPRHAPAPATLPAPAATLASDLGFNPADLTSNQILLRPLKPSHETELSLAAALLVRAPADRIAAFLESASALRADPQTRAVTDAPPAFDPSESGEARRFLAAKPGRQFNLGPAEFQQLSATKSASDDAITVAAANALLRAILFARADTHRAGSPAAPYARSATTSTSPADALATPSREASLLNPASTTPAPARLLFTKSLVEGRPQFEIVELSVRPHNGGSVYTERHLFALHSYNTLEVVMAVLPHGDHSILFYFNRTWTDELTGFGGPLRRGVAEGRFRSEITAYLDRLRAAMESADPLVPAGRN